MKFSDHTFKNIITIATLEFADDLGKAIQEIDRVLKPGGFLITGCLNELSELGRTKHENEIYRHAHFFKPEELEDHLSFFGDPVIEGCAIIENQYVLDFPDTDQVDLNIRMERGAFLTGFVKKTKS
jgi:SAM-dependent methyltransferase